MSSVGPGSSPRRTAEPNARRRSRLVGTEAHELLAEKGYPRVPQIKPPFERIRDPGRLADMIAWHIELSFPDKQALLATLDPVRRL
jgi:hypothetical protein